MHLNVHEQYLIRLHQPRYRASSKCPQFEREVSSQMAWEAAQLCLTDRFPTVKQVGAVESKLQDMMKQVTTLERPLCHSAGAACQEPTTPESMDRKLGAKAVRTRKPTKTDNGPHGMVADGRRHDRCSWSRRGRMRRRDAGAKETAASDNNLKSHQTMRLLRSPAPELRWLGHYHADATSAGRRHGFGVLGLGRAVDFGWKKLPDNFVEKHGDAGSHRK